MIFIHYLYTGKQIKDLKDLPVKSASTETAKRAHASIIAQYGSIDDNAHYYHAGRGKWSKHIEEVKAKANFSLDKLKAPSIGKARATKDQLKLERNVGIDHRGKIVVDQIRQPVKKVVYFIQMSTDSGKTWGGRNFYILDKKEAYDKVESENSKRSKYGVKYKVTPMMHVSGPGIPHNTFESVSKSNINADNLKQGKPTPRTTKHMPGMKGKAVTKQLIQRYEIQRLEENPHASKEALTKNRTFHATRWKQVATVDGTKSQAIETFKNISKNNTVEYRLINDAQEVIMKKQPSEAKREEAKKQIKSKSKSNLEIMKTADKDLGEYLFLFESLYGKRVKISKRDLKSAKAQLKKDGTFGSDPILSIGVYQPNGQFEHLKI